MVDAQAPLRARAAARRAARHRGAEGRARHGLRSNDEGWAWGQLATDGYVGWLPANALLAPARRADAQGDRRCARWCFPARRSSCRRSRRCRSAPARGDARAGAVRGDGGSASCRRSICAARSSRRRISSRSPSAFSARPICGAARPASASIAPALVQVALDACGIACPRDSDMQERGARHRRCRRLQTCGAAI